MRFFTTFLVSVFMLGAVSSIAHAQELNTSEFCTTVRGDVVAPDDDRWVYCDIHMRQFQHRERMIELQESMRTRAENYKASFKPVIDNYKEELKRYHASLGSDSEEN